MEFPSPNPHPQENITELEMKEAFDIDVIYNDEL